MSTTNAELRDAVAEELQIKGIGSELPAEDSATILLRVARVRAWLESMDLCYWPDDEIPDEVVEPLTMIVASRCAAPFNVEYGKGDAGLRLLRAVVAARPSTTPTQAVYY